MTIIRLRRGTAAAWTSANPTLSMGEPGYETDTGNLKVGDGSTAWNSLAYYSTGTFSGDAGDVPFTPAGTIAATDVQAAIEEVAAEAGGGSTPTGTGFRHVAAGVEDAAAKLVEIADVNANLKPSGSAASTDESLRRLGTGSTHAAAGDDARFPTTGQKNALAGTSGTPGTGNEYVTDDDPRMTAGADLATHLADTVDAHDASAVSVNSATLVGTGTDAQAVFEELDDAIAALVGASGVPTSTIDAKGDLLVGSANDAIDNLTVGTNDHVLTADSTQTLGVKWAAAPGGGIPATLFDAQGDIIVASAADTAARLPVGAVGTVLRSTGTTLAYALPVGHEFDYAERTTDLTITATSAATAQVVVSGNAVTYDGSTRVLITLFASLLTADTDLSATVNLWDGSTDLNRIWQIQNVASGSTTGLIQAGVAASRLLTPSAGAHTYHFKAWKGGGSAQIGAVAGTWLPAYIRITKA